MSRAVAECDWKYMQGIKSDLLDSLCDRINKKSVAILTDDTISEHNKYLKLFEHIKDSDGIIADCFNDWRRSTLMMRLVAIQIHNLLPPDHLKQLSNEAQVTLKALVDIYK